MIEPVALAHVALLTHAAVNDLRSRSYANQPILIGLALSICLADATTMNGWNLMIAGLTFAAWRFRLVGGADAKVLLVLCATAPGLVAAWSALLMWPLAAPLLALDPKKGVPMLAALLPAYVVAVLLPDTILTDWYAWLGRFV